MIKELKDWLNKLRKKEVVEESKDLLPSEQLEEKYKKINKNN